ncbi:MAG: HAMP domain-containing histidine kinase, partial [Anaerolineae bacterium]|nr:HAMP domain-containing histidine kinase [Anaerolineae bacterium]
RRLNEFVTNTLHDLRTPLSSIGTSAYIAGRIEDAAKRGERLEHIQTEVRQIGKLLDQFAEMVRLNQMEGVVLTPLALNPIVVRAAAEYQVLAERKGVRVVTEVFPGELVAPVSDLLLQTALIQVLNNAVRYTPSGGLITLRTHCRETHALIEIADTGEGIPAAALQRVFDVQYKGNTARTADGSTGGIGLSMVKRILELHHGRVDITSIVGQGTTVSLIIPIHTPPS